MKVYMPLNKETKKKNQHPHSSWNLELKELKRKFSLRDTSENNILEIFCSIHDDYLG